MSNRTNDEQSTLWNGPAGHAWVDAEAVLDQILQPFELLLVEAVRAGSGRCVLDVGCGTGGTTLAVARALGREGRCTGVDISEPMITAALSSWAGSCCGVLVIASATSITPASSSSVAWGAGAASGTKRPSSRANRPSIADKR